MKRAKKVKLIGENAKASNGDLNTFQEKYPTVCSYCKTIIKNWESHVAHKCPKPQCPSCSAIFEFDLQLNFHKKNCPGVSNAKDGALIDNTTKFICQSCQKCFSNEKLLDDHLSLCNEKILCEMCSDVLSSRNEQYCTKCLSTIHKASQGYTSRHSNESSKSIKESSICKPSDEIFNNHAVNQDLANQNNLRSNKLKRKLLNADKLLDHKKSDENKTHDTLPKSNYSNGDNSMSVISSKRLKKDFVNDKLESNRRDSDDTLKISESVRKKLPKKCFTKEDIASPMQRLKSSKSQVSKIHTTNVRDSIHNSQKCNLKVSNESPKEKHQASFMKRGGNVSTPLPDSIKIHSLFNYLPDAHSGILLQIDSGFKCPKCFRFFKSLKHGSNHFPSCKHAKCKKSTVNASRVKWICMVCHSLFHHVSALSNHRRLCFVSRQIGKTPRNDLKASQDYVRACSNVCPRCNFRCISSVLFKKHECEKELESMRSCFVPLDKLPRIDANAEGNLSIYECQYCKRFFNIQGVFAQHMQKHHGQLPRTIRPMNLSLNRKQSSWTTIKVERISEDNENSDASCDYPIYCDNNAGLPNTSGSLLENSVDHEGFCVPRQLRRYASYSSNANSNFEPSSSASSCAEDFPVDNTVSSLSNEEAGVNIMRFNQQVCRCKLKSAVGMEDTKPCLKCLTEVRLSRMTTNIDSLPFNYVHIKQEKGEEGMPNENLSEVDADLFNVLDFDMPLGFDKCAKFELAPQLHRNFSPSSSLRGLTPPLTPENGRLQSPPGCVLSNEPISQSEPRVSRSPETMAASEPLCMPSRVQNELPGKNEVNQPNDPLPSPEACSITHIWTEIYENIDAFAFVPSRDCETVYKYVCFHCFLHYIQKDSFFRHLWSEHGQRHTVISAAYFVHPVVEMTNS